MNKPAALIAAALAAALLAGGTRSAAAGWSANGSGSAGAAATTMPSGASPTAAATGTSVTVRWPVATFPGGTPVGGYRITRYNAINGSSVRVGGTCAGVVTTTSCTEITAPGTWVYTDTPVQSNWIGGESAPSNAVTT